MKLLDEMSEKIFVIPPNRVRYLSEISENNRAYDKWAIEQKNIAQNLYSLQKSLSILANASEDVITQIQSRIRNNSVGFAPKKQNPN